MLQTETGRHAPTAKQLLGRQVARVKRDAKAQLSTGLGGHPLLYHLGNHDRQHPEVEAFHHAVHEVARILHHVQWLYPYEGTAVADGG